MRSYAVGSLTCGPHRVGAHMSPRKEGGTAQQTSRDGEAREGDGSTMPSCANLPLHAPPGRSNSLPHAWSHSHVT
jgi:hypothetical protein